MRQQFFLLFIVFCTFCVSIFGVLQTHSIKRFANYTVKHPYDVTVVIVDSLVACAALLKTENEFGFTFNEISLECTIYKREGVNCALNYVTISNVYIKPTSSVECSKFVDNLLMLICTAYLGQTNKGQTLFEAVRKTI